MYINYCAHADTKVSYTIVLTIPCAINASPNHKYAYMLVNFSAEDEAPPI